MGARRGLTRARRLVVKVGSGLITSPGEGLDAKRITALAAEMKAAPQPRFKGRPTKKTRRDYERNYEEAVCTR